MKVLVVVTILLLSITPQYEFLTIYHQSSLLRVKKALYMSASLISFGKAMKISVELPTKDTTMVNKFFKNPRNVVESTWAAGKFKNIDNKTFVLQFISIPIPGVDVITPEISVDFFNDENNNIVMQSGNYTLRGNTGAVMKDTTFLKSFEIDINGKLWMQVNPTDQSVSAEGLINYKVNGQKPVLLRAAPSFIVDGVIDFIQSNIGNFVTKKFSGRLQQSFRKFYNEYQLAEIEKDNVLPNVATLTVPTN
eukprot:gene13658-18330_t